MPTDQTITSDGYISGVQRIYSNAWISSTKKEIKSDTMIAEVKSTIICDGGIISNIIDEFGSDEMTLRVVTKTFEDEYGDATKTYVDSKKTGLIQRYTANDTEVMEGIFKAGTVTISFKKSEESGIKTGNQILYAGDWYQIDQVYKQPLGGTLYFLTAIVQKI